MLKRNKNFVGWFVASLVSIVVVDFALGETAEYLNAYEVLRRSLPWPLPLPPTSATAVYGQHTLGAAALALGWGGWFVEGGVIALMLQAVARNVGWRSSRSQAAQQSLALKKVLVTGGTRGIGRALAEQLVQEGCEVMVCGSSREHVARVQQELGVRGIACDLSSAQDVERLASAVRGELGGLDMLINNAGVQCEQDLTAGFDLADARRELEINLVAPVALGQALLPVLMGSRSAVIANVTSALAFAPSSRAPIYCASKAGLAAFTSCLRQQLEDAGVKVVEIVPPLVATEMTVGRQTGAISPDEMAREIVQGLKSGRPRLLVGKARVLAAIHRVAPGLSERMMRGR